MNRIRYQGTADVHVAPRPIGWEVRRDSERQATSLHRTRWSAMRAGRLLADESQTRLIVHRLDGEIATEGDRT